MSICSSRLLQTGLRMHAVVESWAQVQVQQTHAWLSFTTARFVLQSLAGSQMVPPCQHWSLMPSCSIRVDCMRFQCSMLSWHCAGTAYLTISFCMHAVVGQDATAYLWGGHSPQKHLKYDWNMGRHPEQIPRQPVTGQLPPCTQPAL